MLQRALALIVLMPLLLIQPAQADDLMTTAEAYLKSIRAKEWTTMASFLAPDARYQDFSMEYFDRSMIDLVGPEAIVAFWRESAEGAQTLEVRFDVDERFIAGPNVFLSGHGYVRARGEAWDAPGREIEVRFRHLIHLRIVDGKVTDHADHVDYADFMAQVAEQRTASD